MEHKHTGRPKKNTIRIGNIKMGIRNMQQSYWMKMEFHTPKKYVGLWNICEVVRLSENSITTYEYIEWPTWHQIYQS